MHFIDLIIANSITMTTRISLFLSFFSVLDAAQYDLNYDVRIDRIQKALRQYDEGRLSLSKSDSREELHLQQQKEAIDNMSTKRHMLMNSNIMDVSFLQRVMEDNNTGDDIYETCMQENESIRHYFSGEPAWFYYSENALNNKDFSSYYECNGDDDFMTCDYTGVLEALIGSCQLYGGVMYSLNVGNTCSEGTSWSDKNFPVCLGSSCSLDEDILKNTPFFNTCPDSLLTFDSEITKMGSLISDTCKSELDIIKETSDYYDPNFAWNLDGSIDLYCEYGTSEEEGVFKDKCDFTPLLEEYREPCEALGGTLYKFSDEVYFTEGYYGGKPYEGEYKNQPVCIGTSCDAKNYFEKLIFPTLELELSGDYYQNETLWYTGTYTPTDYSSVIKNKENPYSNFLLKSEIVNGEQVDTIMKCKWLAKQAYKKRKRICSKKKHQKYSEASEVGPASIVCTETCAPYCRKETGAAKFVHKIDDDGELITKQCKWLKKQNSAKIESICGSVVDVEEDTIYGQAAETCTKTCGSC
jgi:hypothetical protein